MGEKTLEFRTSLSVAECGQGFRSAIESGRGASARIGGITAKLMGGEALAFYTPQDDSPFAALDDHPPQFSVGVAVPKAQGGHANGTNVHMQIWEEGSHREVVLGAHHSPTGVTHATKPMNAMRSEIER